MMYLSQLLGTPVEDLQGVRVGKIIDIVTPVGARFNMPTTSSTPSISSLSTPSSIPTLVVEGQADQTWYVPVEDVEWNGNALRLRIPVDQLPTRPAEPHEVSLAQEVLDKQVIDVEHKKAVRVDDVCLSDDWQILGIDNSALGLVRRLAPSWLLGARSQQPPATLIPGQGARLIEGLDDETAADTMEEIDTERQRHILENIQADRAADILEAMDPDEAADLLAQLPEERAQELLGLMTPEESEDVQDLLEYEEDTAGGLMTTDYIGLNTTRKVADALDAVRAYMQEQDIRAAYVYCVADEKADESSLLGVVSIWDLLVARPSQPLQELMKPDLITVQPDTDRLTVAQVIAKYNLLAVPVVSPEGILEGVVTVDDALDVLLPADRRRKPTRMY